MSEQFLAQAQVLVTPSTKGFREQLRKDLETSTKDVRARVVVRPDMKGFQAELRKRVNSATSNVRARVLVRADMTGFVTDLRKKVQKAAEQVTATVRTTAVPPTGAAAAGVPPTGDVRTTARRITGPTRAQEAKQAEIIASKIRQAFLKMEDLRVKDAATAAAQIVAIWETAEAERLAISRTANAEGLAEYRAFLAEEDAAAKAQRTAFEQRVSKITGDPAFVKGQKVRANLLKEEAAISRGLTTARRRLSVLDLEGAGAANALAAARAKSNAAEGLTERLQILVGRARQTHNRTIIEQAERLHALAAAELREANTTRDALATQDKAARAREFRTRGFGAQIASFFGLRGAVLAANAQFIAGTVAAIAFGKAVKSIADLESELNVFAVAAGATASEMERVSAAAEALGRDVSLPGVNAATAAQAMTELAKAGLTVEDSMAGARGVLQLSTAAAIDTETAVRLAASALNAFGLAGDEAVRVADVLTNAANASQGSIEDMGIALQQAAAVARQVGISFQDTVAFLTLLARNGIKGSDAGTSLRVAFTRLINPTAKAAAVLDELNVQLRDAQGNIRPEVFTDFARAQAGLTKQQQDANAAIVFGTDALRAYSIISREGVGGFNEVGAALERQGAAAELANARMSGLRGAAANAQNQLEALGLTLGEIVKGPLILFTNILGDAVGGLNALASGLVNIVKEAKGAFDELNRVASIEIFGQNINPQKIIDLANPLKVIPDAFKLAGRVIDDTSVRITGARAHVLDLVQSMNQVGGLTKINQTVTDLKKLQKEFATGDEQSRKFAEDIGVFIKQIQKVSSAPDIDPFELSIEIPPELLSGDPGRVAGEASKRAFLAAIEFGPGDQFGLPALEKNLRAETEAIFTEAGLAAKAAFLKSSAITGADVSRKTVRLTELQRVAVDIEIEGGPEEDRRALRNLRDQEREARGILRTRQKRLDEALATGFIGGFRASKAQIQKRRQERDAAKDELRRIINEERGITDRIAQEAEQAANERERRAREAEQRRKDADQAVIDAFTRRQEDFDARAFQAGLDDSLKNDLQVARKYKKFLFSQIAILKDRIKDKATERDILRVVRDALRKIDAEITGYRKQIRENAQEALRERLGLQLERAQLRLELGIGTRAAVLAVYDKMIAAKRIELRKAKGQRDLELQIGNELLQIQVDRKNFLEEAAEEAKKGTTAFDLLRQSAETFAKSGGSLITGRQPFAGPAGFTANIAQWLQATNRVAGGQIDLTAPRAGGPPTQRERVERELVDAIRENTRALTGRAGNRTTQPILAVAPQPVTTFAGPLQPLSVRAARYWEARQTREALEANNG